MTQQSALTEQQVRDRVRDRLVSGDISREQASQVLQAWKARSGAAMGAQQQAPGQQPEMQESGGGAIRAITQSAPYQMANRAAAGFNRALLGTGEAVLSMGSSAIAEPIAGSAGLASLAATNPDQAAQNVETVRQGLTYEPKSQAGQQAMQDAGSALALVGKGFQAAEQAAGNVGYAVAGPVGGAVGSAIPAAIAEILPLKMTRQAKKAALQRAVDEAGPSILTPEARQALLKQGFDEAELATMATQDPAQLERLARFQRLGIQPTRGDITQRLEDQKPEAQLFQQGQGEAGAGIRNLRQQQTRGLEDALRQIAGDRGVDGQSMAALGDTIKSAVASRRKLLREEVKGAYDALSQAQGNVDVPLVMTDFRALPEVPQGPELRSIQRADRAKFNAFEDLMAEYGLSNNADAIGRLESDGVTPQSLNLSNFEDFRKALNVAERSDQTGNLSRVIGPIKRELDRQVDVMTETLEMSENPSISALAKDARLSHSAFKTEFDPNTLAEQMVSNRPRSNLPQIENSQVYKKIAANNATIEQTDRLIQTLRNQGAAGKRAIADLQGQVMLDILDSSLQGITRKVDGQQMISGPSMTRRFNQLEDKARLIFEDDPGSFKLLQDVVSTAQDVTPQNIAVPKGSAGFLMEIADKTGMKRVMQTIPGGQVIIEGLSELAARSQSRQAFERALDARPDLKRTATILATDYPSIGAALGIGYLTSQGEDDDTNTN